MPDSILDTIKQMLGIDVSYTAFDTDILVNINTAIASLTQIGVGPTSGFTVLDDGETWDDYIGDDPRLASVKSYIYAKTKLVFDPPTSGSAKEALDKLVDELEWRLSITT